MNSILYAVAGFASGALGAMGLGGGSILVIYLTLFANIEQHQAQGINLIFFIFMALVAVLIYLHKKLINLKIIWPALILGIPGAIIGFYLSYMIDSSILSKLFGLLLLFIGAKQILKK